MSDTPIAKRLAAIVFDRERNVYFPDEPDRPLEHRLTTAEINEICAAIVDGPSEYEIARKFVERVNGRAENERQRRDAMQAGALSWTQLIYDAINAELQAMKEGE